MAWRSFLRSKPIEEKSVSPTIAGYVISPGATTLGLYRKSGISYESAAKEGYQKNTIVYRAINEVATAVASVPWLSYQQLRSGDRQEIPSPLILTRPNPYQSLSSYLYDAVCFYLVAGNCYPEMIAPTPQRPPLQLYLQRPDRIRPILGKAGIDGYGLVTQGGIKPMPEWQVNPATGLSNILHLKTFNPLDDWQGISPIEAAALGIDVHNDANVWNANLLRRGASSDMALVTKQLTDKQFSRLKDQLDQHSGASNVKGFLLIETGEDTEYKFERISFSPRDMSWIQSKNTSAHEIALALGGSAMPFLLGLPGTTTYSNQREARLAFWDSTVLPLLFRIRDEFNYWLAPRLSEGLMFDVDLDSISALEPRREMLWQRMQAANFLTINEKRTTLGYDPVEGGDVILQPATMLPLGTEPTEQTQPAKAAARFERELVIGGIAPALAKELTEQTYNGAVKEER